MLVLVKAAPRSTILSPLVAANVQLLVWFNKMVPSWFPPLVSVWAVALAAHRTIRKKGKENNDMKLAGG